MISSPGIALAWASMLTGRGTATAQPSQVDLLLAAILGPLLSLGQVPLLAAESIRVDGEPSFRFMPRGCWVAALPGPRAAAGTPHVAAWRTISAV
jgi:hypothetical protein